MADVENFCHVAVIVESGADGYPKRLPPQPHESAGTILTIVGRGAIAGTRVLMTPDDGEPVPGLLHVCRRCGCVFWVLGG